MDGGEADGRVEDAGEDHLIEGLFVGEAAVRALLAQVRLYVTPNLKTTWLHKRNRLPSRPALISPGRMTALRK